MKGNKKKMPVICSTDGLSSRILHEFIVHEDIMTCIIRPSTESGGLKEMCTGKFFLSVKNERSDRVAPL